MTGGNAYGKDCYDLDIVAPLTEKCLRNSQVIIPQDVLSTDLIIRPDGTNKRKRKSISSTSDESSSSTNLPAPKTSTGSIPSTSSVSSSLLANLPAPKTSTDNTKTGKSRGAKVKKLPATKFTKPRAVKSKPPAVKVTTKPSMPKVTTNPSMPKGTRQKPTKASTNTTKASAREPIVGSKRSNGKSGDSDIDSDDDENVDCNIDKFREQIRRDTKIMAKKELQENMRRGQATVVEVRASLGQEAAQEYNAYLKGLQSAKARVERSRSRDRSRVSSPKRRGGRSRSRERSRLSSAYTTDESSYSRERSTSKDPVMQQLIETTNQARRESVKIAMMNCDADVSDVKEVFGHDYALQYKKLMRVRGIGAEHGRDNSLANWKNRSCDPDSTNDRMRDKERSRSRERSTSVLDKSNGQVYWKNRKQDRMSDYINARSGRDSFDDRLSVNDHGRSYNNDRSGRDSFEDRRRDNDYRPSYNNDRRDGHLDNAKALAMMSIVDTMKHLL